MFFYVTKKTSKIKKKVVVRGNMMNHPVPAASSFSCTSFESAMSHNTGWIAVPHCCMYVCTHIMSGFVWLWHIIRNGYNIYRNPMWEVNMYIRVHCDPSTVMILWYRTRMDPLLWSTSYTSCTQPFRSIDVYSLLYVHIYMWEAWLSFYSYAWDYSVVEAFILCMQQ